MYMLYKIPQIHVRRHKRLAEDSTMLSSKEGGTNSKLENIRDKNFLGVKPDRLNIGRLNKWKLEGGGTLHVMEKR
jgi:hypothetical protein